MPIKRIRSTIASLQAVDRVADRSGNVTIRGAGVTGITGNYTVCHHPFVVILGDIVFFGYRTESSA
jgi:hypothetical protein